jgi:sirohydrochlorin cobaltochelatase
MVRGDKTTEPIAQPAEALEKPTILLVAAGSAQSTTQKTFGHIEERARKRYPGYEVRWAFTSRVIRERLLSQAQPVHSVQEALQLMGQGGTKSVALQSLHIVPGQEFAEISKVEEADLTVALGAPLLATAQDIEATIEALSSELCPHWPNVVAAHGNPHDRVHNQQLEAFARRLRTRFPGAITCSLEGQPGTGGLEEARRQARDAGGVHFIPLMLVAGAHVARDILGDEADSWKRLVAAPATTCSRPLGENDAVLDIVFQHLDAALGTIVPNRKTTVGANQTPIDAPD